MPRRKSEWEQARESFLGIQETPKTVEEREYVPEKSCGKCQHFSVSTGLGSAGGHCLVLKTGSDISVDPPVLLTEGVANLQSDVRMDAARCTHYEPMGLMDQDISESFDPRYSRHQRQTM